MRKADEVPEQHTDCNKEEIVHQLIEVQAQVTVTPLVEHGEPKVYCIDSEIKRDRNCDCVWGTGRKRDKCTFTLRQVICVEIPLTIGADVDVDQGISRCFRPEFGPCMPQHKNTCEK